LFDWYFASEDGEFQFRTVLNALGARFVGDLVGEADFPKQTAAGTAYWVTEGMVARFGAMDLLVDPYTLSSSGGIQIVVLQDVDIKTRHDESFCKIVDMITA
jgi:hypothetical protein